MSGRTTTPRPLTGRKVLAIALVSFGIVIAVNVTMAVLAVGGFPGLVSTNPYAEGQHFDAELKAERALGWRFESGWREGALRVSIAGPEGGPVEGLEVIAVVGRPATQSEDFTLALRADEGAYAAPAPLAAGLWRVEITARRGDGAVYHITDQVYVPKGDAE